MCAFYFFWLSASHGLRLGMDGMLLALCDHGFERSGLCAVNNNNNNNNKRPAKAPLVCNYLEVTWPYAGGLSAVVVIVVLYSSH